MDADRSTLCSFCERISPTTTMFYHYPRFSALQASAESCPICAMLLTLFEPPVLDEVTQAAKDPNNYTKVIIQTVSGARGKDQVGDFAVQEVEVVTRSNYFYSHTFVVNFDGGPFSDRQIWKSDKPITFEDSFPVLEDWFTECTSDHSLCSRQPGELPTRLLCVGSEADSTIRLKITEGQTGTYAALSHCWGSVHDSTQTTKDNLQRHLENVDETLLPQTFKDAVSVARKLKIPYVWIDSLCIIQDDQEDWEKEASRMASVFRNAYLTMAATASEDSHGGCFSSRDPAMHVKVSGVGSNNKKVSNTAYVRYPAEENASLIQSPLFQRGWVLQEMVLSTRTVHFARDQLFWHCRSRITSEDGYFDAKLATTFFDLKTPEKAHQSWWTWVEDYSTRKLTRETDKFAALAGLTKAFRSAGKPIAGLWSDDVHFGLMWCVKGPSTRSSVPGVPSWSWASVNGPVKSLIARQSKIWANHSSSMIKHAELLDANVQWSSAPLTSTIVHASLKLRARIGIAILQEIENQDAITNSWSGEQDIRDFNYHRFAKMYALIPHLTDFEDSTKNFTGYCSIDLEPPEMGSQVLCLLLSTEVCDTTRRTYARDKTCSETEKRDNGTCSHEISHVLLIESTGAVDEYRRIGVGTVGNGNACETMFLGMDEYDITLV